MYVKYWQNLILYVEISLLLFQRKIPMQKSTCLASVNSKCYYFMNYDPPWNDWAGRYRMNYTEARDFCHVVGGKLFEPKNMKVNNLVNKAASKWLKISSYWIGINNITRDSVWR